MKIGILVAGAVVASVMLMGVPAQARAAGQHGAKTGEVKDELKELRAAVELHHKAREAKDKAGEQAAAQTVRAIWNELPAKVKEHILKKHSELAKRIESIVGAGV